MVSVGKFLVVVFYLLAVAIFPSYIAYLFFINESASFSIVSMVFFGVMIFLCLVLIVFLFSSRVRKIFLLE